MQSTGRTQEPSLLISMPSGQKHLKDSVCSSAGLGFSQVGPGDLLNRGVWPAGQSVGDGESVQNYRHVLKCIVIATLHHTFN